MASQVDIGNLALTDLGAARVTSFEDTSKGAGILSTIYESTRDAELQAHPWTFATTRAQLPALSTPPAFGWNLAYKLPTDFLKLVQLGDGYVFYVVPSGTGPLFTVEDRSILTDISAPLPIRYVRRITDAGRFSALFTLALAKRLSIFMCEAMTQNVGKKQQLIVEYKDIISQAKRANDIELPPMPLAPQSWELSQMQLDG